MMLRHRVGYSAFARGVGRVLSRWWSGCVWLWLAWAVVLPAFGQGRPDIVWMRGGHSGFVNSVAFSPDGRLIASGGDRTIKLWRVSDGALVRTLTGHTNGVSSVAFSPDGSLLASGSWDYTIRLWRVSDGALVRTLTGHTNGVFSVAFSPDGSLMASGSGDSTIRLWRVSDGALVRTLTGHTEWVISVAFSPDGSLLASGSEDATIKLWRVSDGALVRTLTGHTNRVISVAFSPDGSLLASGSRDYTVRLWRVSDGALVRTLTGHTDWVYSVAFSPDGSLIASGSGSRDRTIRLWRVSDGALVRTLTGHRWDVYCVAFSPDGSLIASGSEDATIKLWRVSDGALVRTLTWHTAGVLSVAFSPDGRLIASGGDRTIRLWRVSDGALVRTLTGHTDWVESVAFSPDGSLMASGGDRTIRLWRVSDGALVRTLTGHTDWVNSVAFSPDGSLIASGSDDRTIRLWRVSDGALVRTLTGHTSYVESVAFSPDGSLMASGSDDRTIRLWRVSDGALVRTLTGHTDWVYSVAFSPDGSLMASGSRDRTIRLWRVSDGALVRTLTGHTDWVYSVAFSPDGSLIASGSGSGDSTIRLWRVSDGALVQTYDQETGTAVLSIQFSPNGQLFGYGRGDATVVVARNPFYPFPITIIEEGPGADSWVCAEPIVFRWRGVDDSTPPEALYFRWRLNEGDWSEWSRATSVELTGLSAEAHTFEVQAMDADGNIGEPAQRGFFFGARNLQVTQLQAPQEIWNDTQFAITWEITNTGTRRAGDWRDRVYFSRDNRLDGSDRLIGEYLFSSTLEPGQSVVRTQLISIPRSWISGEGTYYLIVATDLENPCLSSYSMLARGVRARLLALPDLVVPSVQAPATAVFGQTIEVRWQVRNQGQGATTSAWYERVVLARDTAGQSVVAQLRVPNRAALAAGERYTTTANLTIPRELVGRHYLIVIADSQNELEEQDENNNRSQAVAIDITTPPLPDLVVPQVIAPAQSYAGQSVRVRWRVENRGTRDIPAGERGFYDALYLSTDTTLDSRDRFVGNRYFGGNLLPGEGYTVVDFPMTIPRDLPAGDYYLLVLTDSTNRVYEFVGEQNNVGVSATPIQVLAVPPETVDLQVVEVEASSGQAGETISVRWRVVNTGTARAPAPWTDAVYLSDRPTLDRRRATRLATFVYTSDLSGGETYEHTEIIRLPDCLPAGRYYLFVATDDTDVVVEHNPPADAEANNVSAPASLSTQLRAADLTVAIIDSPAQAVSGSTITVAWQVRNLGNGATPESEWTDRLRLARADGSTVQVLGEFLRNGSLAPGASYTRRVTVQLPANLRGNYRLVVETDATNRVVECNGEDNNAAHAPIQINYPPLPNLQARQVMIDRASVQVLQPLIVSWQVVNSGEGSAAGWTDGIYLSRTPNVDGAMLLMRIPAPTTLAPNQWYQQQATVSIPPVPPGQYYVLVMADDTARVFEGDGEGDNAAYAFPLRVSVPAVDLTVEAVDAPSQATAGLPVEVVWIVRNAGVEATYAPWSDALFLSRDMVLDTTDLLLGTYRHAEPLAAGAARTVRHSMRLPDYLSGTHYVIVVSDYGRELLETSEGNNTGVDTQVMVITLAPPADLVVQSVSTPAAGMPGAPMPIQWVVRNAGSRAAVGEWYDSVYLSTDNRWDIDDVLIGQFTHSGRLEPGASYTGQLNEPLPGVTPGRYYILVRTDARNTIREVDDENNLGVAGPAVLDVIELQLGVPFSNTLTSNARSHYYKINVPAGQTLLWSVDSQLETMETELFVRYNQIALRSAYDHRNERPFGADQEVLIPRSEGGYYYGLVYGAESPQNSPYQTVVEALPFGIRTVTPNIYGNAGYASLRILGAQLENVVSAFIILPNGQRRPAVAVSVASSSEVSALFNLRGVPEGTYTIGVRASNGAESLAENALQVVTETASQPLLSVRVTGPEEIRSGAQANYHITLYNSALNDAIGVTLLVKIPAGTPYLLPNLIQQEELEEEEADIMDLLEQLPLHYDSPDGWRFILLLVPIVPARGSTTIPLNLTHLAGEILTVEAIVFEGMPAFEVRDDGLFGDPRSSCMAQLMNTLLGCLRALLSTLGVNIPLIDTCLGTIAKSIFGIVTSGWKLAKQGGLWAVLRFAVRLLRGIISSIRRCFVNFWNNIVEEIRRWLRYLTVFLGWLDCFIRAADAYDACKENDRKDTPVRRPIDPNEKQAPAGFGEGRFVTGREPIPYTILFENLPTAQAHAYQVLITDQLDPNLDWRTFEVGTISFRGGRYTVDAPPGQRYFETEVRMSQDDGGLLVRVQAGIDLSTGVVTYRLTAIDPRTGEPPTSPRLGILPPNNEQREGEGFVTFRVAPKPSVASGTVITNSATIVFDTEASIETNVEFNTIDKEPPTTSMAALPRYAHRTWVPIRWSGDDAGGSGVRSYTVWVSIDGGLFRKWLSDVTFTEAPFDVQPGCHRYAFYVTAADNVGNLMSPPLQPQLVIETFVGDINQDRVVDDADLLEVLFAFGNRGNNIPADVTGDGVVDDGDLNVVLSNFGAGC
jgi:WD40 repeat protein/subtilase family serine protease